METIIDFLLYTFIFAIYAVGGALSFHEGIANLKQNKTIRAGFWFMLLVWYVICLAHMRFNY